MASDMNQCNFIGRLTKDPDLKTLPSSGKSVVNFSLAVNGYKDSVEYVNLVAFDKAADIIAQYMTKGSRMMVSGNLKTRKWEKDGQKHSVAEFIVRDFQFLDSKSDAPAQQPRQQESAPDVFDSDPIPF